MVFGLIDIGSVVMHAGAAINFVQYLSELLSLSTLLYLNVSYLKSYFEFLDIPNNKLSVEKGLGYNNKEHIIKFMEVSFKYPHTDQYIL